MIKKYLFLRDPGAGNGGGGAKQTPQLIGQASEDQIKQWKEKYPLGIYNIKADGHVGYFQEPTREHVNCALAANDYNKPLQVNEELANLTFIGGSDVFLTNDAFSLGIAGVMKRKMDGKMVEVENL